jgi:flavin-binding protein dodecin
LAADEISILILSMKTIVDLLAENRERGRFWSEHIGWKSEFVSREGHASKFGCFLRSRDTQFVSPGRMVTGAIRNEAFMAKKTGSKESVYNVIEVIGTSTQSWEDAARNAVETAAKTVRDLRIAEVVKMDMKVENGKITEYRTRVLLSFKYEG